MIANGLHHSTADNGPTHRCGSAFRLPRKSESGTVGRSSHLKGRNEVEDLRSRSPAVGDRALPDAGDRPALISLSTERPGEGCIDGGSGTGAAAGISVQGSKGRSPSPAPMYVHRVGWLMVPMGP